MAISYSRFFEIFPHYRRTFFLDIFLPLVLFLSNLLIKQSNRVLVALDALGCYCLFINRLRTGLVPNERKIPSRNRDFPGNVYLAAMFVKWRDRISQLFSRRSLSLSLSRLLSFQVRKKRGATVTTVNLPRIRTSHPLISILNGIRKIKDATSRNNFIQTHDLIDIVRRSIESIPLESISRLNFSLGTVNDRG